MSRGSRSIPLVWKGPIPFNAKALSDYETSLAEKEGTVNATCSLRRPGVYAIGREERGMLIIGCTPLYVGQSTDIGARLRRHLSPTARGEALNNHLNEKPTFIWYALLDARDLEEAEEALIRYHRPLANALHAPSEPGYRVVLQAPVPNWRRNP